MLEQDDLAMCFACILYLYISLASRRFVHAHWTYLYNGRKVGQLFSLLRTLLRRSLARSGPLWLEESSTSTQQVPPCQLFSLHTSCGQLDHSPAGETRRAVTWAAMLPGRSPRDGESTDCAMRFSFMCYTRSGLCSGDNEKRTNSYLPTRDRREI